MHFEYTSRFMLLVMALCFSLNDPCFAQEKKQPTAIEDAVKIRSFLQIPQWTTTEERDARLKEVLARHPDPADQANILYYAAIGIACTKDKDPELLFNVAARSLEHLTNKANRAQLMIYWGDHLQFKFRPLKGSAMSSARLSVAEKYIAALVEVDATPDMESMLPKERKPGDPLPVSKDPPPATAPSPTVTKINRGNVKGGVIFIQPPAQPQGSTNQEKRMAIEARIRMRDQAVSCLASIYSLRPYNTVEVEGLANKSLKPEMAAALIAVIKEAVTKRTAAVGGREIDPFPALKTVEQNIPGLSSAPQPAPALPIVNPIAQPAQQNPPSPVWPYWAAFGIVIALGFSAFVYLKRRKQTP